MFARPMRMEWEILKWTIVVMLAASLALLVTRAASGAEARLPSVGLDAAKELPLIKPGPLEKPLVADPHERLWQILQWHREGHAEEALAAWPDAPIDPQRKVWRDIAMGMANLQLGELEAAAQHLEAAGQLEPHNPLVHYYLALLRMDQARQAGEWYEAPAAVLRLAAWRPRQVVPNTRSMFELAAMMEFEQTIALAAHLDRSLLLAPVEPHALAVVPLVTVGDLLEALGASAFEGQSHNMLGAMYLERNWLTMAEEEMDAAAKTGLTVVFGYRDLAAAYERQGQFGDASRAWLKSIGHDRGNVEPLRRALENLGKSLFTP